MGVLDNLDLRGKAIVITGGGRGLGRAMALALADAGASVMLAARTQEQLDATVREIRDGRGVASSFRADMTDSVQVDALVEACVREFGHIDAMFANAGGGGGHVPEIWESTNEQFEAGMATNLSSVFYAARAASRAMVEQGTGGAIVATASAAAYRGHPNWVYGTSKAAVIAFMKMLSRGGGAHGIRANSIVPGIIAAREPRDEQERAQRQQRASFFPVRRTGEAWEMGPLAVFLASDASAYVTGQEFVIDGGIVNAGLAPTFYRPHHEL